MKSAINLGFVFAGYVLIGSMESNAMSLKTGLIWCCVVGVLAFLINRKKSATETSRNGQGTKMSKQRERHQPYCNTRKGGVSSV